MTHKTHRTEDTQDNLYIENSHIENSYVDDEDEHTTQQEHIKNLLWKYEGVVTK